MIVALLTADYATRVLLATVLCLAGMAKLINPAYTAKTIQNFRLVSKRMSAAVGIGLPIVEIGIALGLIIPITVVVMSVIAVALFSIFTFVLTLTLRQGKAAVCGCFGEARQEKISRLTVLRTALFLIASIFLLLNHLMQAEWAGLAISESIQLWVISGGLISTLAGSLLVISGTPDTLMVQGTIRDSSQVDRYRQDHLRQINRRAFLKLLSLVGLVVLLPIPKVDAAGCCKCEYQNHFDPRCCSGSFFAIHHHWKRCYNTCTGTRGNWHRTQSDTCDTCECGFCSDQTWVVDECCYQWECSCCSATCPC
jgi:hypothetical protein